MHCKYLGGSLKVSVLIPTTANMALELMKGKLIKGGKDFSLTDEDYIGKYFDTFQTDLVGYFVGQFDMDMFFKFFYSPLLGCALGNNYIRNYLKIHRYKNKI